MEWRAAVKANLPAAVDLLRQMIALPSVRGQEKEISRYLLSRTAGLASAELLPLPPSLKRDPDYSFPGDAPPYDGEANLRLTLGDGPGRSLAFNTHMDVVPPSGKHSDAFLAKEENGRVFGRGAVDAKGQIAVLWLALKTMQDRGFRPGGRVTIDIVVEEECGGNGTLWVVRNGLQADGAVVLEPTGLEVVHLVRGAVWFTVETHGRSGHSGSPGSTASALKEAIRAMQAIVEVRESLLEKSRREVPAIAGHPNPMPCTFGMLHSGNWPATTPSHALLKGVFGFLPPYRREDIRNLLRESLNHLQAEIRFDMLNNDPSAVGEDHPLVLCLLNAARRAGIDTQPAFMNASCDAWRYSQQLNIPAVVFGPGSLAAAHSSEESIAVEDIARAAEALINLIEIWTGGSRE